MAAAWLTGLEQAIEGGTNTKTVTAAPPIPVAPPVDNTMLYVGIGFGAVVLIGVVIFIITSSKK